MSEGKLEKELRCVKCQIALQLIGGEVSCVNCGPTGDFPIALYWGKMMLMGPEVVSGQVKNKRWAPSSKVPRHKRKHERKRFLRRNV